jgi:hypothetical protein
MTRSAAALGCGFGFQFLVFGFRFSVFGFPITAITAITRDHGDFFTPPPHFVPGDPKRTVPKNKASIVCSVNEVQVFLVSDHPIASEFAFIRVNPR